MTINLTTEQLAGLAYGTSQRNSANPNATPMTDEEFAADLLAVKCNEFATASLTDAVSQTVAKAAGASAEKQTAALAAANAVLDAP